MLLNTGPGILSGAVMEVFAVLPGEPAPTHIERRGPWVDRRLASNHAHGEDAGDINEVSVVLGEGGLAVRKLQEVLEAHLVRVDV